MKREIIDMPKILKTFKFKLLPTSKQISQLDETIGACRFVFNHFLKRHIDEYAEHGKMTFYEQQAVELTTLKKLPEFLWLKDIHAQALQQSLKNLQSAYSNFFKHGSEFPKFKSKKQDGSFTIPQHLKIDNHGLRFSRKIGSIKLISNRKIYGKIKRCIVTKTGLGEFYASILCECEHSPFIKTDKSVGVDLGIKQFATTSDNQVFENPKFFQKYKNKLSKLQSSFDRQLKSSKRREKKRLRIARIHEKIANSRKDCIHKITTDLVKRYDIICIENLDIEEMLQAKFLAGYISDTGWGIFKNQLTYKCQWNDKILIKVDRYFPSSKTCNFCGTVNSDLKLSDREWICKNGHKLDRDFNASQNILNEGLRILNCLG